MEHLQLRGYDAQLLVPEEEDIPLKERVRRANKLSCQIGHPHPIPPPRHKTVSELLYFEVSISDNSPSIIFCNLILWHLYMRFYINIC